MATWQWSYLVYQKTLDDSGTYTHDLPEKDKISALFVDFQATNYATADDAPSILTLISKLEVIAEGSKVLYSLYPITASFEEFIDTEKKPNHYITATASATQHARFLILFGRYLCDEKYGLDTSVYTNVQFKMPYALTDKFVSGSAKITVRALRPIAPEAVGFEGFVRRRDIYSFTTASSGEEVVELPLALPYRRVYTYVQGLTGISKIKVDINDGRLILLEDYFDDIKTWNIKIQPFPVAPGEEDPYQDCLILLDERWTEPLPSATYSKFKVIYTMNASGKTVYTGLEEYAPLALS